MVMTGRDQAATATVLLIAFFLCAFMSIWIRDCLVDVVERGTYKLTDAATKVAASVRRLEDLHRSV